MDTSGRSQTSNDITQLPPLVRREDLLTNEDICEMFGWRPLTVAKYRTRENLPMPYVHIGEKYFYIWPQIAQWLNAIQMENLPYEAELRALSRKIR